ncbi:xanthine permease XanP [Salmonella enterica]|nr:xanthine permease XanP [Salmonella enterica]ECT4578899.1 xanthine permease XanP [Salmonella enterica]EDN2012079.1 xanthine permease XanP [Salmonella enterica]
MSVNAIEPADAQPVAQTQNSELIYRLEDRPPLPQTLFAACQHLLAMFVAVITPALLICQALGLPAQDTQHIISMSLFASGVASIIQIKAWGPVGSGLLSIQGTSFNFVAPLIMGGTALKTGGADVPTMMAALFGTLMLASCTEMVLSRILHLARRIITPLVSGVVVMGMLPENNAPVSQDILMVPTPLYYGLGIDWNLLLPLMLVFMITSLETIGDITATSDVSEQPVSGPLYMKRLKGGVLANGLNSFVSAVFNTFPNSCFGQNNGVIQLTGVASRYVGFVVALMLIVLGLFPAVSGFVQHIPEPVLGGATLVMFGTIAASGVRIVSREPLNRRAILIIALSLAVGLGVSQQPQILQFAPEWVKNLLSSGIAAGGITAIVLNLILPPEKP